MYLPVKEEEFNDAIAAAVRCEPVTDFNPDSDAAPIQKKDKRSGFPVWSVECAYAHDQDFGSEFVTVKMPYAKDPGIRVGPIRFGGLAFRTWDMGGKKGLAVSAESFTQEPSPAAARTPSKSKSDSAA